MLYYFDINTCIVTTVSGVKQHSHVACDAALAASVYIYIYIYIYILLLLIGKYRQFLS